MATRLTGISRGFPNRLIWSPGPVPEEVRFLMGRNWITCAAVDSASPLRISKWFHGRRTSAGSSGRTARSVWPVPLYMTFMSTGAELLKVA